MRSQFHSVLTEKLIAGTTAPLPAFTNRRVVVYRIPNKAQSVIGMRRAGKTTFLYQEMAARMAAGWERNRLVYLNFEDERVSGMTTTELSWLMEEYFALHPEKRGREKTLWCLDEIQLIPGWETFVRRILDSEQVDVFISGSSAKMLSAEVATAMRGRAMEVIVHPFSFREYLAHHGNAVPPSRRVSAAVRSQLEKTFLAYLTNGGFPEAQGLPEATLRALLGGYVDVVLLRDVAERHHMTNIFALRHVSRHLLANPGRPFSVPKIHGVLQSQGVVVAKNTLQEIISHLEDAFLIRSLWMEADSERQRMVNPRKSWPIDTALIRLYDRSGRANLGHALETAVLIELERRRAAVTWVKTAEGTEVDFLARSADGSETLIQVCAEATGEETATREISALLAAGKRHPNAEKLIITLTGRELTTRLPEGVKSRAAWDWFCEDELGEV
jgi:predicted AAA+ superfamily ATPase